MSGNIPNPDAAGLFLAAVARWAQANPKPETGGNPNPEENRDQSGLTPAAERSNGNGKKKVAKQRRVGATGRVGAGQAQPNDAARNIGAGG